MNHIWKKLVLLTFTTVLALHVGSASAQDTSSSSTVKTTSGNEECVISADDL